MSCARAIILISAVLPACVYHAGDTCADDACGPNGSPTARIRGVDASGNLRVGAHTTVLLSAADSSDPEGDLLSFAWTVTGACASNVVGPVGGVELTLANLAPASDCSVTLTATDGTYDSVANAVLLVRDVGPYVSSVAPCVAAFDESSTLPQGTPTNPFCSLQQGLIAAAAYQLAEVALAAEGVHQVGASLVIDRSVTIHGGYIRGSGPWVASTGHSDIQLLAGSDPAADTTLRIASAAVDDTVGVKNVSVFRAAPCAHKCALITVDSTNVVLGDIDLGVSQRGTTVVRQGSPNETYYSLVVTGTGDPLKPRQLTAGKLNIQGASAGYASTGIAIADSVDAVIGDSTINESGHTVVAVGVLRAGTVRIERSTINAASDASTLDLASATSSIAIGVIDGNSDTLGVGSCTALGGPVCGSSVHLTVVSTNITVSKARLGIGLGALGTGTVEFVGTDAQRSIISASARQAYGLLTMATGRADTNIAGVTGGLVNISATATAGPGLPASVAYGWSDGNETGDVPVVSLGSFRPSLTSAQIVANVGSQNVSDLGAVVLRDSTQAQLVGTVIGVDSVSATGVRPTDGWTVTRVAGVRLLRAHGVALEGGSVLMGKVEASWADAALLDGQMNAANDDLARDGNGNSYGSTSVLVNGVSFDGVLSVHHLTGTPLRTCIGLFSTAGALIDGSTIACKLGASEAEPAPTLGGVVLVQTRDVTVSASHITVAADNNGTAERVIGVQDGSRISNVLGSSGLRIARNVMDLSVSSVITIGVRIAGTFDPTVAGSTTNGLSAPGPGPFTPSGPLIDDNVIHLTGAAANLGVLVTSSGATIAFNSIRADDCLRDCLTGYAVGFYLLHINQTSPVMLLANAFSLPNPTFGDATGTAVAAIVEDQVSAQARQVSAVKDNLYGYATGGSPSLYIELSTAGTDPVSPQGATVVDEATLAMSVAAIGNLAKAPLYCPDGIHGDPNGLQVGLADHVDTSPFGSALVTDIDAQKVVIPGGDAGADAIAGPCP